MTKNNSTIINFFTNKRVFYTLLAIIGSGWLSLMLFRYIFLGFYAWDTVLHIQPVINYTVNGNYYNNILSMHPIANHFRPGLLLFYPLIKLIPTGMWMMLAKVIAFLACPFILLYMGKTILKDTRFIYVAPIFWLLNDPIANVVSSQSVSTTLMPPFILLAFLFAWQNKHLYMYLCLVFILLFKENMALIWLSLGMFLVVEKKEYKHGVFIFFIGHFYWFASKLGNNTNVSKRKGNKH